MWKIAPFQKDGDATDTLTAQITVMRFAIALQNSFGALSQEDVSVKVVCATGTTTVGTGRMKKTALAPIVDSSAIATLINLCQHANQTEVANTIGFVVMAKTTAETGLMRLGALVQVRNHIDVTATVSQTSPALKTAHSALRMTAFVTESMTVEIGVTKVDALAKTTKFAADALRILETAKIPEDVSKEKELTMALKTALMAMMSSN